ncbi:hypothetical protein HY745_12000, partial [Candidatus Desantisbacteria bacterium]|nr:hypothetical protein [Candidatus Desantisbacteria bacterium]
VTDFNSTDVFEAVLIVINQTDESKKFSFSASVASGDNPFPPANVNATGGRGMVELTWNENTESIFTKIDYESTFVNDSTFMVRYFTGYNVYRSLSRNEGYSRVNTSLITQNSYVDKKVRGNTQYFYCVTASMARFIVKNGNISLSLPVESFFSVPAPAYAASTGKVRNRCFISNLINSKKILENILQFKDKYLFNNFIGDRVVDWYYK